MFSIICGIPVMCALGFGLHKTYLNLYMLYDDLNKYPHQ